MATVRDLGDLLFLVSKAHHKKARQTFDEIGLFRGQPPVLFEVAAHEGMTQNELAARLEVTPATMTNLLRRIEEAGLISRCRDEQDQRSSRVHLTDLGREKLAQSESLLDRMDETAFAGFSESEQDTFYRFLERVHTNLVNSLED
ncbi:MAG: MarR family transcriptional regulator [Anaerolineaceae bacterium]|nr:MarR family transcriptional regulator [Anaerolineaceae bacterium]